MKISYNDLMKFGAKTGCHQRSDRSFYIKGYQFPICARCTGVLIGYFLTIPIYLCCNLKYWVCIAFCLIILIDWLVQYNKIKESTNIRRLITGILGGIGVFGLQILVVLELLNFKQNI